MAEDWQEKLAKTYNRPMPENRRQDKKDNLQTQDKRKPKLQRQHGGEDMPPNRCLPLYEGLGRNGTEAFLQKEKSALTTANTGLLFDKFCDHWLGTEKKWKPEKPPKKDKAVKQKFLDEIVNQLNARKNTGDLLLQYHSRRSALISALSGEIRSFKTSWRFVSGLGMGHVLETGFVWHRTLGVPYLPGSSVKGLIRAWAKQWEDESKWTEYRRLFGDSKDMGAGSLIVFDAIPADATKLKLEVDIMNPHYGDYYSKKIVNGQPVPPADYLSPTPIFFLTVASGVPFKFALAPRDGEDTDAVAEGFELLTNALENIGAGAKTAVGYGYFTTEVA